MPLDVSMYLGMCRPKNVFILVSLSFDEIICLQETLLHQTQGWENTQEGHTMQYFFKALYPLIVKIINFCYLSVLSKCHWSQRLKPNHDTYTGEATRNTGLALLSSDTAARFY